MLYLCHNAIGKCISIVLREIWQSNLTSFRKIWFNRIGNFNEIHNIFTRVFSIQDNNVSFFSINNFKHLIYAFFRLFDIPTKRYSNDIEKVQNIIEMLLSINFTGISR